MADESDGAAVENTREDSDGTGSDASCEDEEEEEEEEEGGFTFAAATGLAGGGAFGDGGVIGRMYPVFGRPRSPPLREEEKEEDAGTASVRVPLMQLLLAERGSSASGQQPDDEDEDGGDGELDGVPAETYCLWSPGTSPSPSSSPARCPKSGSTGSVLRWRQRFQVGRSHSDGKEKFVFLQDTPGPPGSSPGRTSKAGESPGSSPGRTSRAGDSPGGVHGWSHYGGRGRGSRRSSPTFLPYKQDLVGFFANAGALRRSYHPF